VSSHEENAIELHGAWLHADISLQYMIEPTQAQLSASWLCSTVRFGRLQTPSSAKQLRNLLQLVVAWDPRKPKDGQLAIYNSLRIAVPGAVEQEVRVVCQHVMFTVPRARLTGSCCIVDRS
jgi:hypothetical protein